MPSAIGLADVDLADEFRDLEFANECTGAQVLVRWHKTPIGFIKAPITHGRLDRRTLAQCILTEHSETVIHRLLNAGLVAGESSAGLRVNNLIAVDPVPKAEKFPKVTVAIPTRNRTVSLERCLHSIENLDYPNMEVIVVDNAPDDRRTEQLLKTQFPGFRYLLERRPGTSLARNLAITEASGEIIAFTDDDVVVDQNWVAALAKVFSENADVMAVTGLVVPYELETGAQSLFEQRCSPRNFERRWLRFSPQERLSRSQLELWQYGCGANMAFRKEVFSQIGPMSPLFGGGAPLPCSEDLEIFLRVLKHGSTLVCEPRALVRHTHRRTYGELKAQLFDYGHTSGMYVVCASLYPDQARGLLSVVLRDFCYWKRRELLRSWLTHCSLPRDMALIELIGFLRGIWISLCEIVRAKDHRLIKAPSERSAPKPAAQQVKKSNSKAIAIRTIDLSIPLQPLTDISDCEETRLFVLYAGAPIGTVFIKNCFQSVSISRLADELVNQLGVQILDPGSRLNVEQRTAVARASLTDWLLPAGAESEEKLPDHVKVSIVIGTYDRPTDLRRCLQSLVMQQSKRDIEIVVGDNHPQSGLVSDVVKAFPRVKHVLEPRRGAAYARNAAIQQCTGDIVVTVDDDVRAPHDWLEKLISPFARPDVMSVTGNILPGELKTPAQQAFEYYGNGGLQRGFERWEANKAWLEQFHAQPAEIWRLGGTANASFRRSIFSNSEIGLMEETLGPGTPAGGGEDLYLWYKILQSGGTVVYNAPAFVWHTHRASWADLRLQLFNYGRGLVAFQITTLIREGDFRALYIVNRLIRWDLRRLVMRLIGRSSHPLDLVAIESIGHCVGLLCWLISCVRVWCLGTSEKINRVSLEGTFNDVRELTELVESGNAES
jgi:glycosyltransferase involved in cell wall biosynthesis